MRCCRIDCPTICWYTCINDGSGCVILENKGGRLWSCGNQLLCINVIFLPQTGRIEVLQELLRRIWRDAISSEACQNDGVYHMPP